MASIPQTEQTTSSPNQMDFRLECLIDAADAAFTVQSPMAEDTKFKVSAFPTQASPEIKSIRASSQSDEKSTKKRQQIRTMQKAQKKLKKETMSAKKSMFLFLREPYIASYMQEYLNSPKARGPSTQNNTKVAANAWKWEHKFNWGIFKHLQPKLSGGKPAINITHNRLLLEDIMLLNKGECVRLLISCKHNMLKKKGGNISFQKNLLESVEIDGMHPQTFRKSIYFACDLYVSANPTQRDFNDGNITEHEIRKICTSHGGGGVQFKMTNNQSHLFKFSDIIEQSESLLFYSDKPIERMKQVKRVMRSHDDISRIGGVAARLMDEYFGDTTGFIQVSDFYSYLLKEHDDNEQIKAYKNAPISTERMTKYLELADKHPAFIEFRTALDDSIKKEVDNLYGKFSEFTTPLLSQHAIAGFANQFKTKLPRQYHTILVFLNKHVSTYTLSMMHFETFLTSFLTHF